MLDTDRRVWQRPCVKHKQARAWTELKDAPCAARGQEVNPLRKIVNYDLVGATALPAPPAVPRGPFGGFPPAAQPRGARIPTGHDKKNPAETTIVRYLASCTVLYSHRSCGVYRTAAT